MDRFYLKIIAMTTMLIDHVGVVFYNNMFMFKMIGRIAFPIYCFFLVEGFYHTKNVKKYMLRLGIFALISEIPFDLAFSRKIFDFSHQNVFVTLFLGVVMLYFINKNNNYISKFLIAIAFMLLAEYTFCDYASFGIMLIFVFYLFREKKFEKTLFTVALNVFIGGVQIYAILGVLLLFFYNGKKGKDAKYLFYAFYPVHLLILFLLNIEIFSY